MFEAEQIIRCEGELNFLEVNKMCAEGKNPSFSRVVVEHITVSCMWAAHYNTRIMALIILEYGQHIGFDLLAINHHLCYT